jgi:hypothetical protein
MDSGLLFQGKVPSLDTHFYLFSSLAYICSIWYIEWFTPFGTQKDTHQFYNSYCYLRYSDWLRAGQSGVRILVGEIFCTCPNRLWSPPSLLYNGYWVFPRGKAARSRRSPTPI